MPRMTCIALIVLLLVPCTSNADTIDVQIKGLDDGVKTTKQQDYKEAVLFAKREAIERAGVRIKAITTVKDLVVNSDYIESQAEAVLMPGYNIMDMGYSADGTYQVVLIGKVKMASESLDSKELRYAKSLMERGEWVNARKTITDIINNSKDDNVVAEAMYFQVLWKFTSDERDTFERIKAYYPNSKYVSRLKTLVAEREAEVRREVARDDRFISYVDGTVLDTKTGLMWAAKDNGEDTTWQGAKRYCENYRGDGYTVWRMPTQDELAGLYDKNKSYECADGYDVHLTELIRITAGLPWASETRGSKAALFGFYRAGRIWLDQSHSLDGRALPVRSGK